MASLLLVEDDPASAEYLVQALQGMGHEVRRSVDGVGALRAVRSRRPDLVLTDLWLPRMGGLELLASLQQRWPEVPVVVVTVDEDVDKVVECIRRGAVNYVLKSCSLEKLGATVDRAMMERPASGAPGAPPAPEIVGTSAPMREVREAAVLAARSDVNVVLVGQTGTGKEVVARSIHRNSNLSRRPFLAHNCATAPRELFESLFFGHLRGSFTGAARDQRGLLEEAAGGVLFLDELEALSLDQQAKLLRVLDDGEVRPLGATASRRVEVRFLTATNREPREMIRAGELRPDLYFRLRGFEIRLPPLRDRPEDVEPLARHFLGSRGPKLAPGAVEALLAHSWPGNVRELKSLLRCASSLCGGAPIELAHLRRAGLEPASLLGSAPPSEEPLPSRRLVPLKQLEAEAILQALRVHGGNRSRAARSLGIDRSTLRRKMARLTIEPRSDGTGAETAEEWA